jgi:hypothetical protein
VISVAAPTLPPTARIHHISQLQQTHQNNNTMVKGAGSKSSTKASSKSASKVSNAAKKHMGEGQGKSTKKTKSTLVSLVKAVQDTKRPATRTRGPTPVQSPDSTNRSSITTEQPSIETRDKAAPIGNVEYNGNNIDVDQAEDITATLDAEASARYHKKHDEDNVRNQHLVSVKAITKKHIYLYVSIVWVCRQGSLNTSLTFCLLFLYSLNYFSTNQNRWLTMIQRKNLTAPVVSS